MKHLITYNAPPADDQFAAIDAIELEAIRGEIQGGLGTSRMIDAETVAIDLDAAREAGELLAAGVRVFAARDNDGFYFATEVTA